MTEGSAANQGVFPNGPEELRRALRKSVDTSNAAVGIGEPNDLSLSFLENVHASGDQLRRIKAERRGYVAMMEWGESLAPILQSLPRAEQSAFVDTFLKRHGALADSIVMRALFSGWAVHFPEDAYRYAADTLSGERQIDALSHAIMHWPSAPVETILDHARTLDSEANATLTRLVIARRLQDASQNAATRAARMQDLAGTVETMPDRQQQANAFEQLAFEWSKIDPSAAADWVMENRSLSVMTEKPDDFIEIELQHVLQNWFQQDPESAYAWSLDHYITQPPSPYSDSLLFESMTYYARYESESALAKLEEIEDPHHRQLLAFAYAMTTNKHNPQATFGVLHLIVDPEAREVVHQEAIQALAKHSPMDLAPR